MTHIFMHNHESEISDWLCVQGGTRWNKVERGARAGEAAE